MCIRDRKYTNAVEYSYSVTPQIYRQDVDGIRQVNPDTSFDALGLGSSSGSNSMMSSIMSTDVFYEMPENAGLYESQYDVKAGRWPENYNECVLVLTSGGGISDFLLYTLGLRDSMELDEMIQQFIDEENIDTPENMGSYSYDDIIGITFKLVNSAEYYEYDSQYQVWREDVYKRQPHRRGGDPGGCDSGRDPDGRECHGNRFFKNESEAVPGIPVRHGLDGA